MDPVSGADTSSVDQYSKKLEKEKPDKETELEQESQAEEVQQSKSDLDTARAGGKKATEAQGQEKQDQETTSSVKTKFTSLAGWAGSLVSEGAKSVTESLTNGHSFKQLNTLLTALPNETTKDQEIFKSTIKELGKIQADSSLSHLERNSQTLSTVLEAFSEYRANAVDDTAKKEIEEKQKASVNGILNSALEGSGLEEDKLKTISSLATELLMNLEDKPGTKTNEIQDILSYATKAKDLDLASLSELNDFGSGLAQRVGASYSHLDKDEQIELATKVAKGVFSAVDVAQEYGLDELSDKALNKAFSHLLSDDKNQSFETKAIKAMSHLYSNLNPEAKEKIVGDLAGLAFSTDSYLSSTEKDLISVAQKSFANLSENQVADLGSFALKALTTNAVNKVDDLFSNTNRLAAKLGLSSQQTGSAQKTIADIGVNAFQTLAAKSGSPVDMVQLRAMLHQGPNGLVGSDGHLDNRDAGRIAEQVTRGILDNPITHEERSLNAQAHSQKEAAHQAEVRRQAHPRIRAEADSKEAAVRAKLPFGGWLLNNRINRTRAKRQGAAHQQANNWYPGRRSYDEVTQKMNSSYYATKGQANSQMRNTVGNRVYSEVAGALNNPSSQNSLNLLKKMMDKSSMPNYTRLKGLRKHDLDQLKSLTKLSSSLNSISKPGLKDVMPTDSGLDVNELLGVKPDIQYQRADDNEKHGRFDIFKEKNTNEEFYIFIDKENQVKYAIKKEEGGYSFLKGEGLSYKGKSYNSVIKAFEKAHPQKLDIGSQNVAGSDNDKFDLFSDKSTGQRFYRRTDKNGQVIFAIKSEDGKHGWHKVNDDFSFKGRSYKKLINDFEKQKPRSEFALSRPKQDSTQYASRAINITETRNGANGSKFIYFKDSQGKNYYAIKERNGRVKLRLGTRQSAQVIPENYNFNGVDYSWIAKRLK